MASTKEGLPLPLPHRGKASGPGEVQQVTEVTQLVGEEARTPNPAYFSRETALLRAHALHREKGNSQLWDPLAAHGSKCPAMPRNRSSPSRELNARGFLRHTDAKAHDSLLKGEKFPKRPFPGYKESREA